MPDGNTLVFSAERDGTESLFSLAADGSGSAKRLTDAQPDRPQVPQSVVADGTRLVFSEPGAPPSDLYMLELGEERKVAPLLNASYSENNAEVSPNGRWLAYQSDESGSNEIYVRPFPNVAARRVQISTAGGTRPAWARNGREIFYIKQDGTMVAVPIQANAGNSFSARAPASLFQGPYFAVQAGRTYDVSPDGSRFLMIKNAASTTDAPLPQLWVVLNWQEELKRLVPVK
jgi:eukaryotic-like serine/threonine-protein kinase